MKVRNLKHWIADYLHAIHRMGHVFIVQKPPAHYLGYTKENKAPIILIPGMFSKWNFLKSIADPLSLKGHPIYVLGHLGYNTQEIHHASKLVHDFIEEKGLDKIIVVSHSKGGLVGKHVLAFHNRQNKVKKLITIATPFGGSEIAKIAPLKSVRELVPESEIIQTLQQKKEVNNKIVSIFGVFDNHVWPESSCRLEGAKNIQVNAYGHHKILASKEVVEAVLVEVEK